MQVGGAIGAQPCALGLARVWCLRARLEAVCACPRAGAGDLCQRGTGLVVWDIGLARVREERQDGSDALGRGGLTGGDGNEKSAGRLGITSSDTAWKSLLHEVVVHCAAKNRLAQFVHVTRQPCGRTCAVSTTVGIQYLDLHRTG